MVTSNIDRAKWRQVLCEFWVEDGREYKNLKMESESETAYISITIGIWSK